MKIFCCPFCAYVWEGSLKKIIGSCPRCNAELDFLRAMAK